MSHGWYGVEPGTTTANFITDAVGPEVYFYAEAGETRWLGDERYALKRMAPVREPQAFGIAADEPHSAEYRDVSFFGHRIAPGSTQYTLRLACD